jgi:hypothetical protein
MHMEIPNRPDLDAVVERMASIVRPVLLEPSEISRFGPMWEGESWGLVIHLITDRQLELLMQRDDILMEIEAIAADALRDQDRSSDFNGVSITTQEYIDREYDGNGWAAYHNGGKTWTRKKKSE